MRFFGKRVAVLVTAGALITGGAVAAVPGGVAHASGCTTAGCNLASGDDDYTYIDPVDTNGFADLGFGSGQYGSDITDVSTLSYYTDSSGTIHDEYGSGVFGSGTTGCTDLKAFQTAGGGVWALVTNLDGTGWDTSAVDTLMASSTDRTALANNVVSAMSTGCSNGLKFDGAELDFEQMGSGERTNMNATVDALASALHTAGYLFGVSVFSKSSDQPSGFNTQDAEDWSHITSKADLMNIQGYGYCWENGCLTPPGSQPGPIGPEFWDKATIDYAVTALGSTVVGSQVNFIFPLYGIDWPGSGTGQDVTYTSDSSTTTNANGVKNDVTDIIAHYGGSASFETTDGSGNTVDSPYYDYSDTFGPRTIARHAPPPPSVSHGVWFTDQTMIDDLIKGVAQGSNGPNGIGFWRLGAEDTGIWTAVGNDW